MSVTPKRPKTLDKGVQPPAFSDVRQAVEMRLFKPTLWGTTAREEMRRAMTTLRALEIEIYKARKMCLTQAYANNQLKAGAKRWLSEREHKTTRREDLVRKG